MNDRSRRRGRSRRPKDPTNPTTDSTCCGMRVRGTLVQVIEKYKQLANEAEDKMSAELFKQQVEHYTRQRDKLQEQKDEYHNRNL